MLGGSLVVFRESPGPDFKRDLKKFFKFLKFLKLKIKKTSF
jgi:hypothetical protein